MESEMQTVETRPGLDDYLISLIGGLSLGATAWALAFGALAVIQAAASDGINVLDVIAGVKMVPPPGIDLSQITIKLPSLPESQFLNVAFVAVPIIFGLFVGWLSYRKVLTME